MRKLRSLDTGGGVGGGAHLLLLLLLLFSSPRGQPQGGGNSGVVYAVGATKRRHSVERSPDSHVTDRDCRTQAAPPPLTEAAAASPGAGSSVPVGRCTSRTLPPLCLHTPPPSSSPCGRSCGGGGGVCLSCVVLLCCQVESLAGAAHLANDDAGVLRRPECVNSHLDQKGKSLLAFLTLSVRKPTVRAFVCVALSSMARHDDQLTVNTRTP